MNSILKVLHKAFHNKFFHLSFWLKKKNIIVLLCLLTKAIFSQSPQIVSITPTFNEISTSDNPVISVTFNVSMNTSTFDSLSFSVFGEISGYHSGQINSSNDNKTVLFISGRQYNYGERIRVTLSNKIRTLNGDTLNGFTWEFRIPSKPTYINYDEPVSYDYGSGGYFMQCIDMNNDGYPDIATSSGVILINDGTGNFPTSWVLDDAYGFPPIVVDDFNRDGFMDVFYEGSDGLKIGMGDGKGNFTITTKPYWFDYYISVDLNNDSYPDIAGTIGSEGDTSKSYLKWGIAFNDCTGNFNDTIQYNVFGAGRPASMTSADVDNDGNIDLVIESTLGTGLPPYGFNGIVVCRNNVKGIFDKFESYQYSSANSILDDLYPADFNNDGFTDIAIMGYYGLIVLNHNDGTYATYPNDTTYVREFWGAENSAVMTCSDLDGNGWVDLVLSGFRSKPVGEYPYDILYTIFKNSNSYFPNPFGNTDTLFTDTLPRPIYSVATADLNEDGYLDVVHSGSEVFVTLRKDTVTSVNDNPIINDEFTLYQNYPNPFNSQTQITFQLNKAGNVRLYVYNILGERVRILENRFIIQGNHRIKWDGKDNNNRGLPSGVYFIELDTFTHKKFIKTILLK